MFTVLRLRQVSRRKFGQRLDKTPVIEEVPCGRAHFLQITLPVIHGKVNLSKLWRQGYLDGPLLAPDELELPAGCGALAPDSSAFRARLLCNALLAVLEPFPRAEVVMIDREAKYGALALQILSRQQSLRVVTQNVDVYADWNRRAADLLGAGLMLTESLACVTRAQAVFAPAGGERLAAHPFFFGPGGFTLDDSDLLLPVQIASLRPPEINALDFAAAALEFCGVERLESLTPTHLTLGSTHLSLAQITRQMRQLFFA